MRAILRVLAAVVLVILLIRRSMLSASRVAPWHAQTVKNSMAATRHLALNIAPLISITPTARPMDPAEPVALAAPLEDIDEGEEGDEEPWKQAPLVQLDLPPPPPPASLAHASPPRLLKCSRCGLTRLRSGVDDLNCCYNNGAWAGQCGPPTSGLPFTWEEGFRVCNHMTLAPVAERVHGHQPFVPIAAPPLAGPSLDVEARQPDTSIEPRRSDISILGEGNASIGYQPTHQPTPGQLRAYLLTLQPESVKVRRLRRRLSPAGGRLSVTVLRGVHASEALAVAGVAAERAAAVFGSQVNELEFTSALGCTLSHLRAVRRAMRDRASPALILEEDATLDLQPFWLIPSLASLVTSLPREWEAVQLSIVARQTDWDELRTSWREATRRLGATQLLRQDFYWSSAAYLLHPRGMRRLLDKYHRDGGRKRVQRMAQALPLPNASSSVRWRLGTDRARCIKADTCVLYASLAAESTFVAVPPLFTEAARVTAPKSDAGQGAASAIIGHDTGDQADVHVLSRRASLAFASEAAQEEEAKGLRDGSALSGLRNGSARVVSGGGVDPRLTSLVQHCAAHTAAPGSADSPLLRPVQGSTDGMERAFVLRRAGGEAQVLRLEPGTAANESGHRSSGVVRRLEGSGFVDVGRWHAASRALLLLWHGVAPTGTRVASLCRTNRATDDSHFYTDGNATRLTPLLPPTPSVVRALEHGRPHAWTHNATDAPGRRTPRFWVHDEPALWWRPLLQCTPDWDVGLDSQNSAEVWLLMQLLAHPDRVDDWRDADIIYLP